MLQHAVSPGVPVDPSSTVNPQTDSGRLLPVGRKRAVCLVFNGGAKSRWSDGAAVGTMRITRWLVACVRVSMSFLVGELNGSVDPGTHLLVAHIPVQPRDDRDGQKEVASYPQPGGRTEEFDKRYPRDKQHDRCAHVSQQRTLFGKARAVPSQAVSRTRVLSTRFIHVPNVVIDWWDIQKASWHLTANGRFGRTTCSEGRPAPVGRLPTSPSVRGRFGTSQLGKKSSWTRGERPVAWNDLFRPGRLD